MNILIVGEFSAYAKHLKDGFRKLGHDVCVLQDGDGYKKIQLDDDDISSSPMQLSIFGFKVPGSRALLAELSNWFIKDKIRKRFNYRTIDIVIIVNYIFLSKSLFSVGLKVSYLNKLKKTGTKIIMSACGSDPAMAFTYPEYFRIWGVKHPIKDDRFSYLLTNADIIIPTIYSYYFAIKNYCKKMKIKRCKLSNAVPLPVQIDPKVTINRCEGRKIVIFHGINRPIEKGTPYIKEAMNRIHNEFPQKVVCICKGGMPYAEYIKLFKNVDVLIDQTYNNGWGINAIIGAMNGKCVLAPCGKENEENMKIPSIPFVRIEPNSEQIYNVLKDLILNPEKIDDLKIKSRTFAKTYCASDIIAQRYIELLN